MSGPANADQTPAPARAARSLLAVESGTDRWLVELADVGEVVPLPDITAVPLARTWFAGLVNLRGTLYGVSDLAAFHGGPATPRDDNARLLLAAARHGQQSALLVSRVLGLRGFDDLEDLTATGSGPAWTGDAYRDAKGVRWTRLRLPELLKNRVFLEIGM